MNLQVGGGYLPSAFKACGLLLPEAKTTQDFGLGCRVLAVGFSEQIGTPYIDTVSPRNSFAPLNAEKPAASNHTQPTVNSEHAATGLSLPFLPWRMKAGTLSNAGQCR